MAVAAAIAACAAAVIVMASVARIAAVVAKISCIEFVDTFLTRIRSSRFVSAVGVLSYLVCHFAMPLRGADIECKKPPRMTPDEKRLAREMHFDRHEKPAAIARVLGRDLSCICRLLAQIVGRPLGG